MKLFLQDIEEKAQQFCLCRDIDDLVLLGFDKNAILLQSLNISYHSFQLRKANGKMRLIEAPAEDLKEVLRQFNIYLQCIYFLNQSTASQGYIITPKNEISKKNVLENARLHLNKEYLLNVDFQDFFHQISTERVSQLLTNDPFKFELQTAQILANLFSFKGRLPMGAPTSPVLSNLCTITLDNELNKWADAKNITYTRFVDDLSFSTNEFEFVVEHFQEIDAICKQNGYLINPEKIKYFGKDSLKKVTGLLIRETVDIEDAFYLQLEQDLNRMKHLVEVILINRGVLMNEEVRMFKQEIEGQINFIGMIEGFNSPIFNQYRQKLKAAMNPPDEVLSVRWTNYNYL